MCGIMGLFSLSINNNKKNNLINACKLLSHRGPDDEGFYSNKKILLLHKRLSIIDLKTGKQPIENEDFVLIANGEIYNDLDIRRQIPNFSFKTGSDCESILAVYSKYGLNGFNKLRGMYAFAIYDKKRKKIILGRDPFGIKPLYYFHKNKELIFSSEIKALIAAGNLEIKFKKKKIIELLQLQYNSGISTLFSKILRIRPGEIKVFNSEINTEKSIIFDKSKIFKNKKKISSNKLGKILEKSVELHQRSDVPFGLFFSGGIDSTIILYLMSKISKKKIISYSILFDTPNQFEEKKKLEKIAKECNSKINFVNFSDEDFWNILPKVLKYNDDPILDYAIVPTFRLAQAAKKDVKVILSGEGADEIFAGYGRHRKIKRSFFKKQNYPYGELDKFKTFQERFSGWNFELNFSRFSNVNINLSLLQKLQLFDCNEWLPNNLLIKLDRCLMAHGLEGRTPFIDVDVFKNFFGIDDQLKIKNGLGKFVLRMFLKENLPSYDFSKKKTGFTVPIISWLPKKINEISEYLPNNRLLKKIFKQEDIQRICLKCKTNKNLISVVWRLLCLSVWYEVHFDKALAKQNTFNILKRQG
ncbi:MAG: asparagine synthase (glutamine-hydrolyzing) [Rickettsiales bacterium]|nr:asparagine synthase (glutamine-hydrolyzing) [Rickettsiales bacterium]